MAYIGNKIPANFQSLPAVQRFNGNASATAFTLASAVANDQSILVSVDGVTQDSNAYSVSGTTLTFTAAPSSGTGNIFVNTISPVGSTIVPPDGLAITATTGTFSGALSTIAGTITTASNEEDALLIEQADGTDVGSLRINNGSFIIKGKNASSPVQIQTHDGNEDIEVDPDGFIKFETAGSERLRIDASGNVGIGTNNPQELLHIKDGSIAVGNGTAGNNAVVGRIGFSTDASNSRFIGMESFRGGDAANADLRFHTYGGDSNKGERLRIDSSGNVGIGTTAPAAMLHLSGGNEEAKIKFSVGGAGADNFKIYGSSAGRIYINSYATNTGVYLTYNGTSWTSNSDETLKENITSLGTVGDKLKNYRTSYFNWKADTETPPSRNIGFIAQDWETDFPEVVTKKEGETLGMQYTETIPILLKYIQELEARITALEV